MTDHIKGVVDRRSAQHTQLSRSNVCVANEMHPVLSFCPQGYGNKGITLYDIRAELSCRYKDLRVQYRAPNTEEVFNLLTKETPETFYIGTTGEKAQRAPRLGWVFLYMDSVTEKEAF